MEASAAVPKGPLSYMTPSSGAANLRGSQRSRSLVPASPSQEEEVEIKEEDSDDSESELHAEMEEIEARVIPNPAVSVAREARKSRIKLVKKRKSQIQASDPADIENMVLSPLVEVRGVVEEEVIHAQHLPEMPASVPIRSRAVEEGEKPSVMEEGMDFKYAMGEGDRLPSRLDMVARGSSLDKNAPSTCSSVGGEHKAPLSAGGLRLAGALTTYAGEGYEGEPPGPSLVRKSQELLYAQPHPDQVPMSYPLGERGTREGQPPYGEPAFGGIGLSHDKSSYRGEGEEYTQRNQKKKKKKKTKKLNPGMFRTPPSVAETLSQGGQSHIHVRSGSNMTVRSNVPLHQNGNGLRMVISPLASGRNLASASSSGSVQGMQFTTSCTSCSSHDLDLNRPEGEPQYGTQRYGRDGHVQRSTREPSRESRRKKNQPRSFLGMSMGSGNRAGGGGKRNVSTTSTRNLRLQPSARPGGYPPGRGKGSTEGLFTCGSSRSTRNLQSSYKQGKPLRKSKRQSISMELKKSMNAHARHRDNSLRAMGMPASCRALVASSASSQRQDPVKTKKKSRWSSSKRKKKKKQISSSEDSESSEGSGSSSSDSDDSSEYTSDSDSSD